MPGGEFCEEEKLLPGHIIVSSNSFYHIVMYVHVCTCDFGEEGGNRISPYSWPITNYYHHIP